MKLDKAMNFYQRNYKSLLVIPLILLLFSAFSIYTAIQEDGTPIYRDVSLKGGLSAILTVDTQITAEELDAHLENSFPHHSFQTSELFEEGRKVGFIVDTSLDEEQFIRNVETYFETDFELGDNYASNFISPTLSSAFFKQAVYILLISLFFMSLVIFLYFKKLIPSGAVVLSAIFDIVVTVGILDFFRFEISIAGIGALLMLIGYSIDTDVLLTNRLIKEFGDDYMEKASYAFKTGLLMTVTTLIAGIAALILTNSDVIFEIALILVIGLLVDFISTWIQNAGILLWWLEKNK